MARREMLSGTVNSGNFGGCFDCACGRCHIAAYRGCSSPILQAVKVAIPSSVAFVKQSAFDDLLRRTTNYTGTLE